MIKLRLSLCSTAMLCALLPAASADQTTPVQGIRDKSPQLYALTNATVIPEPGKRLDKATVLISNGKISKIQTQAEVPAGYQTIDASGYFIYPGFIDLYGQYGVEKAPAASHGGRGDGPMYQNPRKGGNAVNAAIHAEQRVGNN